MFSPGRTHRPRPGRRRFPEAIGEEAWARATAAETGCQTSPKPIIMYGVSGTRELSVPGTVLVSWSCYVQEQPV